APDAGAKPVVEFTIDPGPLFVIDQHQVVYRDAGDGRPATFDAAKISVSDKADGASLEANQLRFLDFLLSEGYPRARIVARRAEARMEDGVASAVYEFESGPRATFNGVEVIGADRTDPAFIERLSTWEDGETFNRKALVEFRNELSKTGLFSSVEVDAGAISADGAAPVRVTVEERKNRTVGAGLSYSTSEGPGGRLFFEIRNLAGKGERARAELDGTEVSQAFELQLDKPLPRFPGSAFANLSFINDTTDAFNARSLEIGAGLAKRWLDGRLETRAGLTLETSKVESLLRIAPGIIDPERGGVVFEATRVLRTCLRSRSPGKHRREAMPATGRIRQVPVLRGSRRTSRQLPIRGPASARAAGAPHLMPYPSR
ncbi:MAG: hypothetical protein HC794_09060, partial [Nitrospiraceae bacterium]|nr:hypothetical protein [Nitrospiraceae bacterium]